MASLSVAEAAERLGVNVPRIHQRIADGSLRAQRIGAQWVVDERSLLQVAERRSAGRPLSARSAWAIIAASANDEQLPADLAASERARAHVRLARLLDSACVPESEEDLRQMASRLRLLFQNRARRLLFRVDPGDLADLRSDRRWLALIDSASSGIGSAHVEGYVSSEDLDAVQCDYLLSPADDDANVVIHVVESGQQAYPDSKLRLAADLAEHRSPREEVRAVQLVHELAEHRRGRR